MSEVIHTQGLWEVVESTTPGRFDIITSESDEPICLAAKHEDAALLVFAHSMFALLSFWLDRSKKAPYDEGLSTLSTVTEALLQKANGQGEVRYGAVNLYVAEDAE